LWLLPTEKAFGKNTNQNLAEFIRIYSASNLIEDIVPPVYNHQKLPELEKAYNRKIAICFWCWENAD
jgi:hypothetical protein